MDTNSINWRKLIRHEYAKLNRQFDQKKAKDIKYDDPIIVKFTP